MAHEQTEATREPSPVTEAQERVMIAFQDAALGYGHTSVLRNVTLEVCEGDFLGIVGPNGSGKTTLIKAMLGLLQPLTGSMTISPKHGRPRFGYVPQRETVDTVFPLQVREIVAMG